jgi:hypothetical protein
VGADEFVPDGIVPGGIVPDSIVPDSIVPDSIVPDSKDWTWVIDRPCRECGFDSATLPRAEVAPMIRSNADSWTRVLAGDISSVCRRPAPDRWSPLEYACHVRDVFRIYDYRLELIVRLDDPTYPNWDQDETALDERYDQQDPASVAVGLRDAAQQIATRFAALRDDQWTRTGNRSDGAHFTVDTFARYLVHDVVHHLVDVGEPRLGAPST